jgi:glycosyltransferase involved in cell wall biosynthesis
MNVGPLVTRLRTLFDQYIHEIVLVDDNSQDGTREVIQTLSAEDPRIKPVYRSPPNGVGLALADGMRVSSGQYVLSMDCDFQHLLPEVRELFDAVSEGYDVAVGSRFSRRSVLLNYPFQKIIANRAFHLIANVLLWAQFRDLTNNLKLMRRPVVTRLKLLERGFAVNAEIGLQPLLLGYKVKEVPISWIGRGVDMGISSFRVLRVGGSYSRVLRRLWLFRFCKTGAYRDLAKSVGEPLIISQPKRIGEHRITTDRTPMHLDDKNAS